MSANRLQPSLTIRSDSEIKLTRIRWKTADLKCRASEPDNEVGDTVLVRQHPENKLSPHYSPIPMHVTSRKGSMVTADGGSRKVMRNSSFFKKVPLQVLPHAELSEANPNEELDDVEPTMPQYITCPPEPPSSPLRRSSRVKRQPQHLRILCAQSDFSVRYEIEHTTETMNISVQMSNRYNSTCYCDVLI